uniref:Uncharacterized protein n=1 Tax=Anguilla anguilla TaxID=7936 RepID=A0A0E9TU12_ANGAN
MVDVSLTTTEKQLPRKKHCFFSPWVNRERARETNNVLKVKVPFYFIGFAFGTVSGP